VTTDIFSDLFTVPPSEFDEGGTGGLEEAPPPEPQTVTPALSGGPTCEVCGRDVAYSGRGRKPRFCQDHRTRTSDSARKTAKVSAEDAERADMDKRLKKIVGDLQQGAGELAGTIAPVAPVTAHVVALQAPSAIDSLVSIAEKYPRMLDGLEKAASTVPFISVGKFVAALVLAISVDMGRVTPYGLAAEYLGVAKAAEAAGYQAPAEQQAEAAKNDRTMPPPPRFTMN
jgi:hypothetical protein